MFFTVLLEDTTTILFQFTNKSRYYVGDDFITEHFNRKVIKMSKYKTTDICCSLGEILKQWRFWFDSIGDIRIWMRKTVSLAKMNILVRDYFSINRCNEAETSQ